MEKLSSELTRILQKRIASAIERARYYPATMKDHQKAAFDVIKPYLKKPNADHQDQKKRRDIPTRPSQRPGQLP
jgi:hypothetical protein